MKRTYQWHVEKGEEFTQEQIIPRSRCRRFRVRTVSIETDVELNEKTYAEALCVSGCGYTVWREFHHGTVWVWSEKSCE